MNEIERWSIDDFSRYKTGEDLGIEIGARRNKFLFSYYVNAFDLNEATGISYITPFRRHKYYRAYIPIGSIIKGHILRLRKNKEIKFYKVIEIYSNYVEMQELTESEAKNEIEKLGLKFTRLRKKWITLENFYKQLVEKRQMMEETDVIEAKKLKVGDKFKLGEDIYTVESKTQKYVGLANGEVIKVPRQQKIEFVKGTLVKAKSKPEPEIEQEKITIEKKEGRSDIYNKRQGMLITLEIKSIIEKLNEIDTKFETLKQYEDNPDTTLILKEILESDVESFRKSYEVMKSLIYEKLVKIYNKGEKYL